ncbi:MAG TPA: hypothetical protein VFA46_17170 [Actinomycetes bacterium]|jgi:hypothetical protein|nr:hypothetical protein [Actinomycetes bacterium]
MRLGHISACAGKGLLAGLAGTVAMTASSTVEAKLSGRGASTTPAQAAERVLGVQPEDQKSERRLNNVVHWAYGTGWGAVRGLLGAAGVSGPRAAAAHFATVWGTAQVVQPAIGVSPPAWRWSGRQVAVDVLHHLVYATAASAAYAALER